MHLPHQLTRSCFSVIHSVNAVCYTDCFSHVEPPLPSRNKSRLVMVHNPFHTLLNLVFQHRLGDFCVNIHKGYWS